MTPAAKPVPRMPTLCGMPVAPAPAGLQYFRPSWRRLCCAV